MTMVVTEPCIGCKDKSCLVVCPVECFREDQAMFDIDPDECTECAACIAECPATAIFHEGDVPVAWFNYIELGALKSQDCPSAHD